MIHSSTYPLYKKIVLLMGPVFLLFFCSIAPAAEFQRYAVYGCALWMITWWIAEVVPIYVTAIIPMFAFPALGLFSVKETFMPYANPIIFLFMGGFIIALAMEERRLHIRIALNIIRLTGTKPKGVILGFILATAFLSMWISNTATTVMMLPIALSVVHLLKTQQGDSKPMQVFSLALLLSIAYAANIGGTITLIGTPPNVVFAGLFEEKFGIEIGFGQWLLIGIPSGAILLTALYFLLTRVLLRVKLAEIQGSEELFVQKRKELGPISKAEKWVLAVFCTTAFLWTFKSNINQVLGFPLLHNTSIAMFGGFAMLSIPLDLKSGEALLPWKSMEKLPWGILILFGGGLSLAAALDHVGVISTLGNWVADNSLGGVFWLCIALTLLSIFATEVMSNVALVTILLPVIMGISESMGVSAYTLSIPVTLAASCAFMLPISTPPNAVVYSSGFIRVPQMMRIGVVLNVISALVLALLVPWIIQWVFDIN